MNNWYGWIPALSSASQFAFASPEFFIKIIHFFNFSIFDEKYFGFLKMYGCWKMVYGCKERTVTQVFD